MFHPCFLARGATQSAVNYEKVDYGSHVLQERFSNQQLVSVVSKDLYGGAAEMSSTYTQTPFDTIDEDKKYSERSSFAILRKAYPIMTILVLSHVALKLSCI